MNTDKMKELYESEPDKWVVYVKEARGAMVGQWEKCEPLWNNLLVYKLIAKKDEIVADAVIANPNVEVEWENNMLPRATFAPVTDEFFSFYAKYSKESFNYRLAKPQCDGKFNGGYIKASQEAYDLFVMDTYLHTKNIKPENNGCYIIRKSKVEYWDEESLIHINVDLDYKQFYINNRALSWDEPTSSNDAQVDTQDEQILKLQLQNQRLEKENKQLKNLCKNIQGAVELEMMKINERTKIYEEYEDDK